MNDDDQNGDLATRLERLAPQVDTDVAFEAFGRASARRSRRRRLEVGLGAAAVVVAGAVFATVLATRSDRPSTVITADRRPAPFDEGHQRVETTERGLRLTLDAPERGVVGTRIHVTVAMTNVSGSRIFTGIAGGCDDLLAAHLGSGPAVMSDAERAATAWDGRLGDLDERLKDAPRPSRIDARAPANEWVRSLACTMPALPTPELAAGATVSLTLSIDLRWGLGAPNNSANIVATTGDFDTDHRALAHPPYPPGTTTALSVSAPLRLVDKSHRAATAAAVVGAEGMAAAPKLADWVELSRSAAPGLAMEWYVDLSWWNDHWELWIEPKYIDGKVTGPLLIRWDPATGRVSDVRVINSGNGGPGDVAGAPSGTPPDTVLYRAS